MSLILNTLIIVAILAGVTAEIQAQNAFSYEEQEMVKAFETRANEYDTLRKKVEGRLTKLPAKASVEQIAAHKRALQDHIQKERANAKVGDIFTPESADVIRRMINNEFKGTWEGSEIRRTVLEAETLGVPVKINMPYPDSKELVEMSPTLLLSLPQLPKSLRYRFIGRNLVLMDRDNALIIDHMPNALP